MNATKFYSFLQKKAKLALPVDSEDELGFRDEENEQLATQQDEDKDKSDEDDSKKDDWQDKTRLVHFRSI